MVFVLNYLNEKKINDPKAQAMFKRLKHNIISIFIISQDYYELPKRTITINGNNYDYSNQRL